MRLPRDLNGRELAALLGRHCGYEVARQTGSHLRLVTSTGGEHHVTVPAGGPLRVGDKRELAKRRCDQRLVSGEGGI